MLHYRVEISKIIRFESIRVADDVTDLCKHAPFNLGTSRSISFFKFQWSICKPSILCLVTLIYTFRRIY
jgi:hypothetical protein